MRFTDVFNEEDLDGVDILHGISVESWKPDVQSDRCNACVKKFRPFYRRKHHCRVCGEIYCSKCLQFRYVRVPWIGIALTTVCVWCCDQKATTEEPKSSEFLRLKPLPTPQAPPPSSTTLTIAPNSFVPQRREPTVRNFVRKEISRGSYSRELPPRSTLTIQFKSKPTRPLISPIDSNRRTFSSSSLSSTMVAEDRLMHMCTLLCEAMECSYGAIVLASPTIVVLAHQGLRAYTHTDAFRLICARAMKLGRICCVNQQDHSFQFCGTAPLMNKETLECVGCLVVLDKDQKTLSNPGHVLQHYARVVTDCLAQGYKQTPKRSLEQKLISIRSSSSRRDL